MSHKRGSNGADAVAHAEGDGGGKNKGSSHFRRPRYCSVQETQDVLLNVIDAVLDGTLGTDAANTTIRATKQLVDSEVQRVRRGAQELGTVR